MKLDLDACPQRQTPPHFLTRTKVRPRSLVEWRLQRRLMQWGRRMTIQKLITSWVNDFYTSAQIYPLCFLGCHPPSLPFQTSSGSPSKPFLVPWLSKICFSNSQDIYRLLHMLMFSMWYLVMFTNVFGYLSAHIDYQHPESRHLRLLPLTLVP